ncbi:PDZ and LIM domain protein 2 [Silurus meridionalis]|nr:PDZ and LIM domain protein 2 [Silurus meridionalis]
MAFTVTLTGPSPWGFRISGGRDFKKAITVSKVNPGSKAEKASLQPGDVIMEINGENTGDMLNVEAQNKIKSSKTQLQLLVERPPPSSPGQTNGISSTEQLVGRFQETLQVRDENQNYREYSVSSPTSFSSVPYSPESPSSPDRKWGRITPTTKSRVDANKAGKCPFKKAGCRPERVSAGEWYKEGVSISAASWGVVCPEKSGTYNGGSDAKHSGVCGVGFPVHLKHRLLLVYHSLVGMYGEGGEFLPVDSRCNSVSSRTPTPPDRYSPHSPIDREIPTSPRRNSSDFAMQRFDRESEVYKMIQENKESRSAPRQSNTFKMLQEVLEADEQEAALMFPGKLSPNPPKPVSSVAGVQKYHTCEKCGNNIVTQAVRILDERFRHPECYTCTECGLNLKMRGHFWVGDELFCEKHARQRYQGPGAGYRHPISPQH